MITSDGFFELEEMPKKAAVLGAGYIAVEMAGILNTFGTDTTLFTRGEGPLRDFDNLMRETLSKEMEKQGLKVAGGCTTKRVFKNEDDGTLSIEFENGQI